MSPSARPSRSRSASRSSAPGSLGRRWRIVDAPPAPPDRSRTTSPSTRQAPPAPVASVSVTDTLPTVLAQSDRNPATRSGGSANSKATGRPATPSRPGPSQHPARWLSPRTSPPGPTTSAGPGSNSRTWRSVSTIIWRSPTFSIGPGSGWTAIAIGRSGHAEPGGRPRSRGRTSLLSTAPPGGSRLLRHDIWQLPRHRGRRRPTEVPDPENPGKNVGFPTASDA